MQLGLVHRTKKILGSTTMAVAISVGAVVGAGFCADYALATPVVYASSGDLASAAPTTLLESFEGISADRRVNQHDVLNLEDLTVKASAKRMAVYNRESAGQAAVTGNQYVKYSRESGGSQVTFDFESPVDIFGVSVIDWGERGQGALSLLAEGFGQVHHVETPQPDAGVTFLGIQLPAPVSWFQIVHDLSSESWAFDDVYYGLLSASLTNNSLISGTVSDTVPSAVSSVDAVAVSEPGWLAVLGLACLGLRRKLRGEAV